MKNHSTKLAHGVKYGINHHLEPICCNLCQKETSVIVWFDTYDRGMNICRVCIGHLICIASKNKSESDSFKCGAICSCFDDLSSNLSKFGGHGEYCVGPRKICQSRFSRRPPIVSLETGGPYFYSGFLNAQIWNVDRSSFDPFFSNARCNSCQRFRCCPSPTCQRFRCCPSPTCQRFRCCPSPTCQSNTEELVVLVDEIHDPGFEAYFDDWSFYDNPEIADNYAKRKVALCSKCLAMIAGLIKTRFVFNIFKSSVGKQIIVKRQLDVPRRWSRQSNHAFPLAERQKALFLISFMMRFEKSKCRIGRYISDQILALAFSEN